MRYFPLRIFTDINWKTASLLNVSYFYFIRSFRLFFSWESFHRHHQMDFFRDPLDRVWLWPSIPSFLSAELLCGVSCWHYPVRFFVEVMQIFYPYSMQLNPNVFPGEDPRDCPRNVNKDQWVFLFLYLWYIVHFRLRNRTSNAIKYCVWILHHKQVLLKDSNHVGKVSLSCCSFESKQWAQFKMVFVNWIVTVKVGWLLRAGTLWAHPYLTRERENGYVNGWTAPIFSEHSIWVGLQNWGRGPVVTWQI